MQLRIIYFIKVVMCVVFFGEIATISSIKSMVGISHIAPLLWGTYLNIRKFTHHYILSKTKVALHYKW